MEEGNYASNDIQTAMAGGNTSDAISEIGEYIWVTDYAKRLYHEDQPYTVLFRIVQYPLSETKLHETWTFTVDIYHSL